MNKNFLITASFITGSFLLSSVAIAEDAELNTDKQKFSYGIGLQIGQSIAAQNVEVDQDALIMALKDALSGQEPRVSLEELQKVMTQEEKKMQQKQIAAADKNKQIGQAFLAENKKLDGVKTTASGLQYRIIKAGSGAKPSVSDSVTVHYRGTLIDGHEFDSSYKREQPATFNVNGVVKGWQEALPMMKEGGKWEVFIPSELAYGSKGAGAAIGPDETLIFEIELLSVNK
ncbi:MAG: FKBP-type peptidyl-prolyl cis-trans isomerase [Gammaproteobacteria bacterium]